MKRKGQIMIKTKLPRSTKIVATIGTATDDPNIIKKLIKTGVNVFRLNFSHGNHGDHLKRITFIRSAEKEMNANVAILADLQGPKFRIYHYSSFSFHLYTLV